MPRFTIKRLMIVIGLAAGLLAIWRRVGPFGLIWLGILVLPAGVAWLAVRRRPRLAAWVFATSVVLASATVGPVCAYLYSIGGLILMGTLTWLWWPLMLASGGAWAWYRPAEGRWTRPKSAALVVALAAIPQSIWVTPWPLHLAFRLSRPAMDRLADRVAGGAPLITPEWAGVYRVVAAVREPTNGNIALIIDADPNGRSGFVRTTGVPPHPSLLPLSNLNFDEPVGGPWRYQNED